ncbi:DUF362 domain-containing protein [Candidatus Calescamantes bacterium]|nr:DUF362 domain-containing protein [Candidatus Calescamantes bacterium]
MRNKTLVALVPQERYAKEEVYQAINKGLALIQAEKLISSSSLKVLLKINLLSATPPEKGIITHPEVVGAVTRWFRERGCEVWVGDAAFTGDMGAEVGEKKDPFSITGIRKVVEEEGGKIINFNREGYREVKINGKRVKTLHLAEPLFQVDIVVSVAKLKTHELTFITGAVKNFFGCIPSRDRNLLHRDGDPEKFSENVLDLFSVCRCDLGIIDGIEGMEGEGPAHGKVRKVGILLFAKNPHALDAVMAKIMGFSPYEIPLLYLAEKRGWVDLESIEVIGEELEKFIISDFEKPSTFLSKRKRNILKLLAPLGVPLLDTYPKLEREKCIQCGLCKERCPVEAIELTPYPQVNYGKCIRCFTCIEICPQGAFHPSHSFLTRILRKIRH